MNNPGDKEGAKIKIVFGKSNPNQMPNEMGENEQNEQNEENMEFKISDLKGGNVPDDQFDPKELELGTQHEMEHTDKEPLAEAIAKGHILEKPNYYSTLPMGHKKPLMQKGNEAQKANLENMKSEMMGKLSS
jgi:hypothetical protein